MLQLGRFLLNINIYFLKHRHDQNNAGRLGKLKTKLHKEIYLTNFIGENNSKIVGNFNSTSLRVKIPWFIM